MNTNENKPHKHAHLMMEYAKDAMETDKPWERWEFKEPDGDRWHSHQLNPYWDNHYEYRRKPRTILINGIELTEPYRGEMKNYQEYYIPNIFNESSFSTHIWIDGRLDNIWRKKGLVHLTEEAAIKHAKALLSFTKQL